MNLSRPICASLKYKVIRGTTSALRGLWCDGQPHLSGPRPMAPHRESVCPRRGVTTHTLRQPQLRTLRAAPGARQHRPTSARALSGCVALPDQTHTLAWKHARHVLPADDHEPSGAIRSGPLCPWLSLHTSHEAPLPGTPAPALRPLRAHPGRRAAQVSPAGHTMPPGSALSSSDVRFKCTKAQNDPEGTQPVSARVPTAVGVCGGDSAHVCVCAHGCACAEGTQPVCVRVPTAVCVCARVQSRGIPQPPVRLRGLSVSRLGYSVPSPLCQWTFR